MVFEQYTVYANRTKGYNTFRIPAVLCTPNGTVLAFCEGRRNNSADVGAIDIVLRRSLDGGKTWSDMTVVVDGGGDTAGNPTPVVDKASGDVVLLFCRNPVNASGPRTVFVTRSPDHGVTWTTPVEITSSVSSSSSAR